MDQRCSLEENSEKCELNDDENTAYQNLWNAVKAVLGRKYIALSACIRKQERSKISDLRFHLRKLDNTEQLA